MATATNIDVTRPLQLVPVHSCTGEVLKDRPTLTLESDASIVFLGTNDNTGILDPSLSHKVVKVYVKRQKLFAFCLPDGHGTAKLNGTDIPTGYRRELRLGDKVALRSSDEDDYIYRVEQQEQEVAAQAASASASSSTTTTIPNDAANIQQEVGEEAICAVCMDIMVEPRTIVPCGHSFCRQCIATLGECAECRGAISSHIVCRSLQNLIQKLVDASAQQGVPIFEKDDVECYRTRTGNKGGASSSSSAGSARKRRRAAQSAVPPGPPAGFFNGGILDLTS